MKKLSTLLLSACAVVYCFECDAQTVSGNISGYDYVDLGLPSGKLWASYNVGATEPTDFGSSFAWGETAPKSSYTYKNYKWATSETTYTKYCTHSYYGTVDDLLVLVPEDDAAIANWGIGWRMPTTEEQVELSKGCDWKTVSDFNGTKVAGKLGTSKTNGNTIFLPFQAGGSTRYWSSSVYRNNSNQARVIDIDEKNFFMSMLAVRTQGNKVRAIASGKVASDELLYQDQMYYLVDGGSIRIANAKANHKLQVFDLNGKAIASSVTDGNGNAVVALPFTNGVYVVTVGNQSLKVVFK